MARALATNTMQKIIVIATKYLQRAPAKKLSGQLGLELGAPVAEEIGESGRVHRAAADYVLWRAFSRVKRHFSGFSQFGRCLGSHQGLLSLFNQMGFAGQQ